MSPCSHSIVSPSDADAPTVTPIARSSRPSPSKSPDASVPPKKSFSSPMSSTPGLFCDQNWLRAAARPAAEPYITLTAPCEWIGVASSGTPIARSSNAVAVEVAGGECVALVFEDLGVVEDPRAVL